jgi:hypothetical protein
MLSGGLNGSIGFAGCGRGTSMRGATGGSGMRGGRVGGSPGNGRGSLGGRG